MPIVSLAPHWHVTALSAIDEDDAGQLHGDRCAHEPLLSFATLSCTCKLTALPIHFSTSILARTMADRVGRAGLVTARARWEGRRRAIAGLRRAYRTQDCTSEHTVQPRCACKEQPRPSNMRLTEKCGCSFEHGSTSSSTRSDTNAPIPRHASHRIAPSAVFHPRISRRRRLVNCPACTFLTPLTWPALLIVGSSDPTVNSRQRAMEVSGNV